MGVHHCLQDDRHTDSNKVSKGGDCKSDADCPEPHSKCAKLSKMRFFLLILLIVAMAVEICSALSCQTDDDCAGIWIHPPFTCIKNGAGAGYCGHLEP
ncbi:unnamed protein product, partial [Mesorhabditis spiculigera]